MAKPIMKAPEAGAWILKHELFCWGEQWTGTKQQLQEAGIGRDSSFPGDPGGPKKSVVTTGPLGFRMKVSMPRYRGLPQGVFEATCRYVERAGWEGRYLEQAVWHAPGVTLKRCLYGADEYRGSAAALVACGLVPLDKLPGQPGRNKVSCLYDPSGALCRQGSFIWCAPGAMSIQKTGADRFEVGIRVPQEESDRRKLVRKEIEARHAHEDLAAKMQRMEMYKQLRHPLIERAEKAAESKRQAERRQAEIEKLKSLPATRQAFRDDVAEGFWIFVNAATRLMRPKVGFSFAEDFIDEFRESASAIYWSIKDGEVQGKSPKEELKLMLIEASKADLTLQRLIASAAEAR